MCRKVGLKQTDGFMFALYSAITHADPARKDTGLASKWLDIFEKSTARGDGWNHWLFGYLHVTMVHVHMGLWKAISAKGIVQRELHPDGGGDDDESNDYDDVGNML